MLVGVQLLVLQELFMKLQVQVKAVAVFCDKDKVRRAGPGENLRVRLAGIEEEDIISGFVLSSVGMHSFYDYFNELGESCAEIVDYKRAF